MDDHATFIIKIECYEKIKKKIIETGNEFKIKINNDNYIDILVLKELDDKSHIDIPLENMIELDMFLIENNIEAEIDFIVYKSILRHNYVNLLDYYIKNPKRLDHNWSHYSDDMLLSQSCGLSNMNTVIFLLEKTSGKGICKTLETICSFNKILPNGQLGTASNLYKNQIEIIKLLLDKLNDLSYDINYSSSYNLFKAAMRSNNPKIIKLLINYGLNINEYRNELLRAAFTGRCMEVADFLFESGGSMDIYFSDLKFHVKTNSVERVKFIFNHYDIEQKWIDNIFVKFNKYSRCPIIFLGQKCVGMLQIFIDNGANIKKYGQKVCDEFETSKKYDLANYLKKRMRY
jgi:hypothetical protein